MTRQVIAGDDRYSFRPQVLVNFPSINASLSDWLSPLGRQTITALTLG